MTSFPEMRPRGERPITLGLLLLAVSLVGLLSAFAFIALSSLSHERGAAQHVLHQPRIPAWPESARLVAQTAKPHASLTIRFRPGFTAAKRRDLLARFGAVETGSIPQLGLHVVAVSRAKARPLLRRLRASKAVASVTPDEVRGIAGGSSASIAGQWALRKIEAPTAYRDATLKRHVRVAILDTAGPNGDPNGHGTWMASIVRATDPAAEIVPVQVLNADGYGADSTVIRGLVSAADRHTQVILMSFAGPAFSPALQRAIDYAWSKGSVVVAATGNEGSSTATYPAGDAKVVGVSATDEHDNLWTKSNYGTDTFLAAPGAGVVTRDRSGSATVINGTSASAAFVAGGAAVLLGADRKATNAVVVGRLARNADRAGSALQTGHGRLDVLRALRDRRRLALVPTGVDGRTANGGFPGYESAGSATGPTAAGTASATTTGTTLTVTLSANVPVNATLVIIAAQNATTTGTTTATDNLATHNTYVEDKQSDNASGVHVAILRSAVTQALTATTNTVTITFPASSGARAASVMYFTGVKTTSPVDGSGAGSGSSGTTGTASTTATTQATDLVLAGLTSVKSVAAAITCTATTMVGSVNTLEEEALYASVSATGAQTCSGTVGNNNAWAEAIAAYKIDVTNPTSAVTTTGGFNTAGWPGSVSGTATDESGGSGLDTTVGKTQLSIHDDTANTYWDGVSAWGAVAGAETYFNPTTSPGTVAPGTAASWSYTFGSANLTLGHSYTVHVKTTDLAGNSNSAAVGSGSFNYETTAPSSATLTTNGVYNSAGWGGSVQGTVSDSGTGNNGISAVNVSIQDSVSGKCWNGTNFTTAACPNWVAVTSGGTATGSANANWSYTLAAGALTTGHTYTVSVQATDATTNGNQSGTLSAGSFTYDTSAPTSAALTTNGNYNSAGWPGSVQGTVSDSGTGNNGISAVNVSIQDSVSGKCWNGTNFTTAACQNWIAVTSGGTASGSANASWSYTLASSALTTGHTYTVSVQATDATSNGNQSGTLSAGTFTYDTSAPTSASLTTNGNYNSGGWPGSVQGTVSDSATGGHGISAVNVSIQDSVSSKCWNGTNFTTAACQNWIAVTSGGTASGSANASWSYTLASSALTDGHTYTVSVQATDATTNGNQSATLSAGTFTYDTSAPTSATLTTNGNYNSGGWPGAISGNVSDSATGSHGISAVNVSIQDSVSGKCWNGTNFTTAACQNWIAVTSGGTATGSANASWSYTLASSALTDGHTYTVSVQATDATTNGNQSATLSAGTFTYDTSAPTSATLTTNGNYNSGGWPGAVQGTVSDSATGSHGISAVNVSIQDSVSSKCWNGTNFTTAACQNWIAVTSGGTASGSANASWSYTLASAALTDGHTYTVSVQATDATSNGNQSATLSAGTFTYDTSAPSAVALTTSGNYNSAGWGGSVQGTVSDSGTGSHGIAAVNVSIQDSVSNKCWNGTNFTTAACPNFLAVTSGSTATGSSNASWSYTLASSALTDGHTYTVKVQTTDGTTNGNQSGTLSAGTFTYDTSAPTSATLTTNANYNSAGWPGSVQGTVSDSATGGHGISAVNVSIQDSVSNKCWNGTNFTTAACQNWIAVTSGGTASGSANASWSYTLASSALTDGHTYTVSVQATDATSNGNQSATLSAGTFTYDTSAPTSASLTTNGNYNSAGWPGSVQGTVSDSGTGGHGISAVNVSIQDSVSGKCWNGTNFTTAACQNWIAVTSGGTASGSANASWSYTLASSALTTGHTYTVSVQATDATTNGNQSATLSAGAFTYDTSAPSSASLTTNGSYNSGGWPGAISGTVSDSGTGGHGISAVNVSIQDSVSSKCWNGTNFTTAACQNWIAVTSGGTATGSANASWSYTLASSALTDGHTYTVSVQATDATTNGNQSAALSAGTFKYDTTAPSSTTTFPASSGRYNTAGWNAGCATAGLCGTAFDGTSGVQRVDVSIKRSTDSMYWNGTGWLSVSESMQLAAGTTSWSYAFATANLTDGATYTVHEIATDNAGNVETSSTFTFVYDSSAPTLSSASTNTAGTQLTLAYNESLNTGSTPAASAFTVNVNGSNQAAPTNVSVSGSSVTLTLAAPVYGADTVTVSYTQPGSNQVKDLAGNLAANLSSQAVTNNAYAADGTGSVSASVSNVANGSTGNTVAFTYTAGAGGISNGSVTVDVPAGWSAPSTSSSAAGYSTASTGTLAVASQKITVSSVTLAGGATLTITYGASPGPGAVATTTGGSATWQVQEKSTNGGTLTNVSPSPAINVYAGDGSGTLGASVANVANGSTGNTVTFTYTAAAGGISNGAVTIAAPAGWSAPSTTSNANGYTTSSTGSVSVGGQTITVSGVTLSGGSTFTVTYGSTSGGGSGATATTTAGSATWQAQEKSTAGGSLTNLGGSPSINVYSADGAGNLNADTSTVPYASIGNTITFTYTAATGGLSNGSVKLTVPSGWSAPSTTSSANGYSTASTGTLSASGQDITVSGVTLGAGSTLTIVYGSKASGGAGATAPSAGGSATWQAQEKSTSGGSLTNLAASPAVNVTAQDGSGTIGASVSNVANGSTGNTITFTYTAATGGLNSGAVTLAVPAGWSAPSTTSNAAGYTTASTGSVSASGQTITVSGVTLAGGSTLTVTYGATSGGGSGATATTTGGSATWQAQEKSTAGGSLTNLSSSPTINVYAADGSGTLTTPTTSVYAGSSGNTIVFTYTVATGGISNGSVNVAVPAGWSAPSGLSSDAGYVTASAGSVGASGQTITVSNLTLAGGATFTITYGASIGAVATTTAGSQTWQAQQKSTAGGSLTNLASSPSINVTSSADGSGTMSVSPTTTLASSTGNTLTFTYTAATGGLGSGAVTVDVPAGWSAPSTTGTAAGYTTSSTGTVSVSGSTITVSNVTLSSGQTFTVTYGATSGGGAGATSTGTSGSQTWTTKERSTPGGTLTDLASSPSVTVNNAADGSGSLSVSPTSVLAGQTGRTLTFTYTAATAGMTNGAVAIDVPSGWSAPSTTGSAAGYATASTGTVSVSGSTITVSGVTLSGSATMTISYGATSGGGSGATATTTRGTQTWNAKQKSVAAGTLTALSSSPTEDVNDSADGSGTLTTPTTTVLAGSSGHTITFTYTAATGGTTNGAVTLDVPNGWTAPSTTSSANGYTTSSAGTVSVSGQTVTVSGLALNGGDTFTVTYGDTSGGGSGATAPTSVGSQTWNAKEKSTSGGALTALGSSPAIGVGNSPDGSGTLSVAPTSVLAGQTGRTLTFTYTAATGGTTNGALTVDLPAGWSAPSTTGSADGYTTASAGTVSVSGQTITISGVSLNAGQTLTVAYGDTSGGGAGATASQTRGSATLSANEKSTSGGTLTALSSSPSIAVNDSADGSGSLGANPTTQLAGDTDRTVTLTYTAATGGLTNGAVTVDVPSGWSAPSTTASTNGYTTASTGTVSVSGQTITVSGVSLNGGQTLTVTYGDTSGGGAGVTVPQTRGSATWSAKERSTGGGALTALAGSPSVNVTDSPDGSGTLGVSPNSVLAGQTGRTLTFTYTAATGGLTSGAVTIDVPNGWSAPSTTASANGYTTASAGSVSVSGRAITVSGVSRNGGQTFTVTYGDTSGGGSGATVTTTTGGAAWNAQEKSTAGGTLQGLGVSPSVLVSNSADGSGTLTTPTSSVLAGTTGHTVAFTYTAATGGLANGVVTVDVPSGWSAPSTTSSANGYTTSSAGSVSVSGQTITVSGVSRMDGQTFTITYGDTSGGGAGATATTSAGTQAWSAKEESTVGGTLTGLGSSPSIDVNNSADGSGTLTTPTSSVLAGTAGHTVTFTYTAAPGGLANGAVSVDVPSGWTAPSTTSSANGYTTASAGTVAVSGQTITVSGVTLNGGQTLTVTYGDTSGGGSGATSTTTAGTQSWNGKERSTSGGTPAALGSSPSIDVNNSADGSGTLTTPTSSVLAGTAGHTITLTYTAAAGGLTNGAVSVVVPSGWSAPSTTAAANGYTTSSAGTVSVSGQTVTVTGVTLNGGQAFTITYGDTSGGGSGATSTTTAGTQSWNGKERSTSGGTLTALGSSPSIDVNNSADGSGTLTTPTASVLAATTGHTLTFTYTAAAGGLTNGAVSVDVPTGWSAPSTTASANGYTTASSGTISTSGQVVTVSGVTLNGGQTLTIVYGDTSGGGAGATAPVATGTQTWTGKERSTGGGTLTALGSSPSIDVNNSVDGSGTLSSSASNVFAGSTGRTITFTYTAAPGGMTNGDVTLAVPTGWSAPSTTSSANGYTTASTGNVSVSTRTITASGVSLVGGQTLTLTYGDTSGGGAGATAPTSVGAQTWTSQERSTSGGTLTDLGSSPSITIFDDQSPTGSLTAPSAGAFARGTITLSSNSADVGSGVASAQFQRSPHSANSWTNVGSAVTSSPYQVSFDTTSVADGSWDLRVVTTDNAGNATNSATVAITVDNTAPSSATLDALPAAIKNGQVLTGAGADATSGVASLSYYECAGFACLPTTLVGSSSTGPSYSVTWNAQPADGTYQVLARATDRAGNTLDSATQSVVVDNTNPTGSITAPTASANVRGTITVSSDSADGGSGVASAQFQRSPHGANSWTNVGAAVTSSPYQASLDTTALTDGQYDLRVVTADNAGNTSTSALVTVRVDNTNPTGSITAPADAANVRSTVTVSSDSTDGGSGVASATFQRSPHGANSWTTIGSPVTGSPYQVSLDTTGLSNGQYDLRVVTADSAGNSTTSGSVTVEVDNTAPNGAIVSPLDGAAVRGSITISSDSSDADSGVASAIFQRSPHGANSWTTIGSAVTGSPYQVSLDTTGLSDGQYDLRVVTADNAGNTTTSGSITVTIDNTAPSSATLDALPGAIKNGQALTGSGADATSGVASISYYRCTGGACVPSTLIGSSTNGPSYSVTWSSQPADGTYTLMARVTDGAGNTLDSATQTVVVDNTNPTGSLTAPVDGANVRGTVTVSSNSADGGSGVASATFQRSPHGAGSWTTIGSPVTGSPYQVSLDTTGLTDGQYDLRVITADAAGNSVTSATRTVLVDNTNPSGSVTAPADGADVRQTVTLSANASDAGSGVASVQFQRSPHGAGSWTNVGSAITSAPYNSSLDTTGLADGQYDLRAVVADVAGNSAPTAAVTVLVDNTNPGGSLTAPADGSAVRQTITVSANPTDSGSGVASVQFQRSPAGAGSWTNVGSAVTGSPWQASLDTTTLSDGLYDLRVLVTDAAGNSAPAASVTVRVDNTNPSGSIAAPSDGSAVRATITVSASVADGGSGVASVQFQRSLHGAGSWTNIGAAVTGTPWQTSLDTTTLSEVQYDLRAVVTDTAGNTFATAPNAVTVDNTNPGIASVDSPTGGVVGATVTVSGSASDSGSGIASVKFQYDGGSGWNDIGTDTTSPYSVSWDTTPLGDGNYNLRAVATDRAGNTLTSSTVSVLVDNHAPTVSISAPGTYVNAAASDPFTVTATSPDSDIQKVDFYVCADTSSSCSSNLWNFLGSDTDGAPYTATWTLPPTDGNRALRAVATDNATNVGPAAVVNTLVDRTAPAGGSVSYPTGYRSGSVAITTGDGSDSGSGLDLASRQILRDEATLTNGSCGSFTTTTTVTSPDSTIASGHCYEYRYQLADKAGNVTTYGPNGDVKVDTAAPAGSMTAPAGGTVVRNTITLSGNASDTGGSGVASAQFQRSPHGAGSWTNVGSAVTSSPYQTSLDTTSLGDGQYDLRVVVTDGAGNSTTSSAVTVTVDNTNPTGSISQPADGAKLRGTVTINSNSADATSGVASAQFQRSPAGAGSWVNLGTVTSSPYQVSLDTTLLSDGLYDLRVVTTDNAGNTFTSSAITVRVDNTPPSVTWVNPTAGAAVGASVAFNVSTPDVDPSPTVVYQVAPHGTSSWTTITSPWDATSVPDGDYDLRATATDWAGNTNSATIMVTNDNQPPAVALTAPTDGSFVNAATTDPVSLAATANDGGSGVDHVEFFYCTNSNCSGGSETSLGTDTTAPYTGTWSIPSDGARAIKVVAYDRAGHTASAISNVTVDRAAPSATIVTKPGDPSKAVSPSFTFSGSDAAPGSGVASYECKLDGGSYTACTSPKSYTFTEPPSADGAHTFSVRAIDAAGNTGTADTWTWHRDTTAPTGSLTDPGRNVRQTITLNAPNNDPTANSYASGVASVAYQYSLDGTTWATIGTSTTAPFDTMSWNTTGVSDAVYELRVVVTDLAGNSATSAPVVNVRVDNTPPTASQDDPGQYLRRTITLTGSASDTGSGVDHVDFQVSPAGANSWTNVGSDTTSPYSTSFDTTTLPDGHYDFRTVAFDVAGNQQASSPVTSRLIDNTDPNAAMTDPGQYVRGTVTLGSTTSDPGGPNASGVASVSYEYANESDNVWHPTGPSWNTGSLADGLYDLRVTAVDNAGNSLTSAVVAARRVDNTPPATTDNAPAGYQSSAVTVTLSPSDSGSGVQVTEYKIDGAATFSTGTSVVIPAPSNGSNDGVHTIQYFSVDRAGNIEGVKTTTVKIDATPPVCPSCSAGDYLRGTVSLTANPSDNGAGIASVEFQYSPDGSTWTSIGTATTSPYSANWDTTAVSDGAYHLRALITDGASNVSTVDLHPGGAGVVVVDNTAPSSVSVGSPSEGAIVSGTISVAATASDANPITYQFKANGSTIGSGSSATASWNTTSVGDGPSQLQVTVTDAAGNSTTSPVRNVTVDNTSPTPTLADPGPAAGGTITLSATSDADTAQVAFEYSPVGANTWTTIASDTTSPFSTSFDTTALADGRYDLRAVATDQTGHTGTSSIRTLRVDNTPPNGNLVKPAAGATIGGPHVNLQSTSNDSGSGVASVVYQYRPTSGGAYAAAATATTAPFSATWDATAVATGDYEFRIVVTDSAGNTFTDAPVTAHVDSTAPTVVLDDPGANIDGVTTLTATTSGPDAVRVDFAYSPAGANSWTTIASDTSDPWSTAFDTRTVSDGLYDLRATASDAFGNSSTAVRTNIRIDNTYPSIVSTDPVDGSTIAAASSIVLNVSEAVTMDNVTLDGAATVPPVVTGNQISYPTGALADGPHTLAGELEDAAGKKTPFRLHFTIWTSGGSDAPYVEKNTNSAVATTLTSSNALAHVTMPVGSYGGGSDWLVLRVDPSPAPTSVAGMVPASEVYDVTAWWALAGTGVHSFQQPLAIAISSVGNGVLPATQENGTWRLIPYGSGSSDWFTYDSGQIVIHTYHLTPFVLVRDLTPPTAPSRFSGSVSAGVLSLNWALGADNSGRLSKVLVLANGSVVATLAGDATSTTIAPFADGDSRRFTIREVDAAGNVSADSRALKVVPSLAGKTVDDARAALEAAGFTLGNVTEGTDPKAIPGTVLSPDGLEVAPEGSAVDLVVAPGSVDTKFVFRVSNAPTFSWRKGDVLHARIRTTRASRVTATLYHPRRTKLYTWRFQVKAGISLVKLHLPRQIRRPGTYWLTWVGESGSDRTTKTIKVRILPAGERLGRVVKPATQPVEVVLAGDGIGTDTALGLGGSNVRVLTSTGEGLFDLGSQADVQQMVVIDVDQYDVRYVHDLHALFPAMRIVALAASADKRAAALRAGAKAALASSVPDSDLARAIAQQVR